MKNYLRFVIQQTKRCQKPLDPDYALQLDIERQKVKSATAYVGFPRLVSSAK